MILLAKAVDGVYDSDPKVNPEAVKYDEISIAEVIDKRLSDGVHHVHGEPYADAGIRPGGGRQHRERSEGKVCRNEDYGIGPHYKTSYKKIRAKSGGQELWTRD